MSALVSPPGVRPSLPRPSSPMSVEPGAIREHFHRAADAMERASACCEQSIIAAAEVIAGSMQRGGKLLLCGNGGSAADCQHMAAEFTSRLSSDFVRPGLPAIALTTDTSFLTAYANDFDFEGVYARQIEALGQPGDVLLAISTSGNSRNIVRAVEAAMLRDLRTIGLTGNGGRIKELVDISIAIPAVITQHIQEAHLAVEHIICALVERMLFGPDGLKGPRA
jgi:D-sedoheptulose 7-phosphate isomerase